MYFVGVKVMSENFLEVEPDDNRFKNVKVILITADCSKSGIADPVDFIVNEGEGEIPASPQYQIPRPLS